MTIKKRKGKKLLQPFLTGNERQDSQNYLAWGRSKNAWRPPEEMEALRKWNALSYEEHKKYYPRGTEDYCDQLMYEKLHPGKHFDGDPFAFTKWLNEFKKSRGIPKMSWDNWKTVPPWQKANIEAYQKIKEELGLDTQKAYPPLFLH